MAIEPLKKVLYGNNYKRKEIKSEDGKLLGIVEARPVTITAEYPVFEKEIQLEFVEVTYTVPKLTKHQKNNLEKHAKKNNFVYSIKKVKNEKLLEKGLIETVSVPFTSMEDQKNYKNMSTFNKILRLPDYI